MFDPVAFGKHMARTVLDLIAPLNLKIAELEARKPERGEKGDPGIAGKDGQDGENGRDAVVNYEDIVKAVEETHERLVAKYVLDIERRGIDAINRAVDKLPVPKDGKDGVDGKDGLGFEDVEFAFDGERTVTAKFIRRGIELKSVPIRFPVIVDRGYHLAGRKYDKGDAVTHDGTLWIALKDTDVKPSISATEDWRIGARKGRDGRDGKNGKDAPGPVDLGGN